MNKLRYTLVGCCALLLWACAMPMAKHCTEKLGSITTIAIIYFTSGALGILYLSYSGKLRTLDFLRRRLFYLRLMIFVVYSSLLYVAIGSVPREHFPLIQLLNYLWPTFTLLLSITLLKQRCRIWLLLLGSLTVAVGLSVEILGEHFSVLLAPASNGKTALAAGTATLAAVLWALYTVISKMWGTAAGGAQAIPFILFLASFPLFGLRVVFAETSSFSHEILLPLSYLSLMPILGNICWDLGTRLGSINLLSLLADGLPWVALTATHIYLGVAIGPTTWISALIIVSGAIISRCSLLANTSRGG